MDIFELSPEEYCDAVVSEELTPEEVVTQYTTAVMNGRIVVGKLERLAVERYLKDLDRNDIRLDRELADDACSFFHRILLHTLGKWSGTEFVLYPCQMFVVWNIIGWLNVETGFRRFRKAFLSFARGQGKTPLAAGLLLYIFMFDDPPSPRAEAYVVATKRDQAKICFDDIIHYIRNNEELRSLVSVKQGGVYRDEDGSKIEPLASDSKNTDGLRPLVVVRDEGHEWREKHRGLLEKINTAFGKRDQPLDIAITTAGCEESELWEEEYEFCRSILEGEDADSQFVFIAEIDEEDDPLDEECWIKANPLASYGVVNMDVLRDLKAKAKNNPRAKLELQRYHCNRFTTSHARYMNPEMWSMGSVALPEFDSSVERFLGFDWGWSNDLAAIAFCYITGMVDIEEERKPTYAIKVQAWAPKHGIRDLTQPPFINLIEQGKIITLDGATVNSAVILKYVKDELDELPILQCGFDSNNAREFGDIAENELGINPHKFPQTCAMYNEPMKEFTTALQEGRMVHGNCPLARWAFMNVITKTDPANYVMPDKKRSKDKIDPACATIMALAMAMRHAREEPSVYEERGPLVA